VSERAAGGYGLEWSLIGLLKSSARAVYGVGNVVVDGSPLVAGIRRGNLQSWETWVRAVALLCALALLTGSVWQAAARWPMKQARHTVLFASGWLSPVILFGILWNNSDDQFYFQLSVLLGVLCCGVEWSRRSTAMQLAGVLMAVVLSFNAFDIVENRVLYPRNERVDLLKAQVHGAGLIVFPGYDEVDHLFYFAGLGPDRRLAITSLRNEYPVSEGMEVLRDRVADVLQAGHRVDVIGIYDVPEYQQPWKSLANDGYSLNTVRQALSLFPVEPATRRVGPFTIRSLLPHTPPAGL
jgi:hypothetical protein